MRIRKVEPSIGVVGKIVNSQSTIKTDTYSCDYIDKTTDDKVSAATEEIKNIKTGTVVGATNVTVEYSTYLLIGDILIMACYLVANESVAQYTPVAALSDIVSTDIIAHNAYMYDSNNKKYYLDKRYGTISIYEAGGLAKGASVKFEGVFLLNSN